MMFAFMILCFSLFVSFTHAFPLLSRDVFNPRITSPDAKTVWTVGETNTVTWDTSNLPPDSQLTNPNGMVVLGFLTANSENLMLDHPLAKGFKLSEGKVSITVPSVPTRDDYIIVLFGDSGNASPKFVINGATASSSTSPVSTTTLTTETLTTETVNTPPVSTTTTPVAGDASSTTPSSPSDGEGNNSATSVSPTTQSTVKAPSSPSTPSSPLLSSSSSGSPSALAAATPSSNAAWKSRQLSSPRAHFFALASLILFYAF